MMISIHDRSTFGVASPSFRKSRFCPPRHNYMSRCCAARHVHRSVTQFEPAEFQNGGHFRRDVQRCCGRDTAQMCGIGFSCVLAALRVARKNLPDATRRVGGAKRKCILTRSTTKRKFKCISKTTGNFQRRVARAVVSWGKIKKYNLLKLPGSGKSLILHSKESPKNITFFVKCSTPIL